MAQGIYITQSRPKSKKEVKEASPSDIYIEATSIFGNEYEGRANEMPENEVIYFVGPDPHNNRKFYGQIKRVGDKVTVS